jgi:hypothetical protein
MENSESLQQQNSNTPIKSAKNCDIYFLIISVILWTAGFYKMSFAALLAMLAFLSLRLKQPTSFNHWLVVLLKIIVLLPLILTLAFYFIMSIYQTKVDLLTQGLLYFLSINEYLFNSFLSHIFTGLSNTLADVTTIWKHQHFSEPVIEYYLKPRFQIFMFFVMLMGCYITTQFIRYAFNKDGVVFKSIQDGNYLISKTKIYMQVCFCSILAFACFLVLLYVNLQHQPGSLAKRQYSFNFFSLKDKYFYINLYLSFLIYTKLWLCVSTLAHMVVSSALTLKEKNQK